jgi:hypothetical protein
MFRKKTALQNSLLRIEASLAEIKQGMSSLARSGGTSVNDALQELVRRHSVTIDSGDALAGTYRDWYEGMELSDDWTSNNFPIWEKVLRSHGEKFRNALEVGSFEGRSAVFLLEFLPKLHLTCVDLFQYTDEFFPDRKDMRSEFTGGVRFDKNLSKYSGRYDKIVAPSCNALANMVREKKRFDLIYIDGSHYRDDVVLDAFLSWKLLKEKGIIIFDDYSWRTDLPASDRPKDAIDLFIYCHLDELAILHNGEQLIIKKD